MKRTSLPVIFRKWPESEGGDVIALFPTLPGTSDPYTCSSYERVGQHGSAEPVGLIQMTKLAKPAEYAGLLKELHKIGYRNLAIKQKYQHSYLDERRRAIAAISAPKGTAVKYSIGGSGSRKPGRSTTAGLGGIR